MNYEEAIKWTQASHSHLPLASDCTEVEYLKLAEAEDRDAEFWLDWLDNEPSAWSNRDHWQKRIDSDRDRAAQYRKLAGVA